MSEALESGLLEQNPAGPLWFRHPLQAEALEAEILPTERQAFHARFAAAYEAEASALDTPPAELSQSISDHYALAGRDDETYIWALSAADAMESDGDRTGALRMLRRAAALRPQLEHAPATVEDLLNRTRDMAERVGDWEAEIAAIDTLVPRLQEHDDDDSALEAAALLLAVRFSPTYLGWARQAPTWSSHSRSPLGPRRPGNGSMSWPSTCTSCSGKTAPTTPPRSRTRSERYWPSPRDSGANQPRDGIAPRPTLWQDWQC